MPEEPIGGGLGSQGGSSGGGGGFIGALFGTGDSQRRTMGDVRGRFKVDVTGVSSITTAFKAATDQTKAYRSEVDKLTASTKKLNAEIRETQRLRGGSSSRTPSGMGGGGQGGGTGGGRWGDLGSAAKSAFSKGGGEEAAAAGGEAAAAAGGEAGAMGAAAGGPAAAVVAIAAVAKKMVDATRALIASHAPYALAASQSNTSFQLAGVGSRADMYGIRSNIVRGGVLLGGKDSAAVNSIMQLSRQGGAYDQAGYDRSGQGLAQGVTTLRATSGWAMTPDQATGVLGNITNVQTVNQMRAFYGYSPYKNGQLSGEDPVKGMAVAVMKRFPYFGKREWARALVPGSGIRQALLSTGVPEDMIEPISQYALAQQKYESLGGAKNEKGAGGQYVDLASAKDRKLLGIQDTYATQAEETQMSRLNREENFASRQDDNLASAEHQTRVLEEIKATLEDKLSGILGVLTSNPLLMSGASYATGGALGDATGESTSIPIGYGNKRGPISSLSNNESWSKLSGSMKTRLTQLFEASGGKVGFGGGWRSDAEQEAMFRDRYRPDPNGDITWNGQRWKRVKGAPAAPPGRSMHGIGLAADLVGDMGWLQSNASRFGLKTFASVNDEPWHVQPTELPNSRAEYEKQGGQPLDDSGSMPIEGGAAGGAAAAEKETNGGASGGSLLALFGSIQDFLNGSAIAGGGTVAGLGGTTGSTRSSGGTATPTMATNAQGALSGEDVARIAYNAGFRGETLVKMVAIAKRESGFEPGQITNDSDDSSYGLWQINMLGGLGPARLKQFGISKYSDLNDPNTNARAAWILSGGGSNLMPWKIGGNPLAKTDMAAAQKYVSSAGLGDPTGDGAASSGGSGGSVSIKGGASIVVNATFQVNVSNGDSAAGRQLAREAAKYLQEEIEMAQMRVS